MYELTNSLGISIKMRAGKPANSCIRQRVFWLVESSYDGLYRLSMAGWGCHRQSPVNKDQTIPTSCNYQIRDHLRHSLNDQTWKKFLNIHK